MVFKDTTLENIVNDFVLYFEDWSVHNVQEYTLGLTATNIEININCIITQNINLLVQILCPGL